MGTTHGTDPFGKMYDAGFDAKPDICPRCLQGIDATEIHVAAFSRNPSAGEATIEIVYRCPSQKCSKLFIGLYRRETLGGRPAGSRFVFSSAYPKTFEAPPVLPEIVEVSPQFAPIYAQASEAEARGLDQIAGMGFRKALEFLVKDYCIQETPEDATAIRAELLGRTIANRVSDPNVKQCAERAIWLGNDETHYERRWEDKDIADLKLLVELTMGWIRSSVLTKRMVLDMPRPNR